MTKITFKGLEQNAKLNRIVVSHLVREFIIIITALVRLGLQH